MRLSLATRIFIGYAVILVTFGAVSAFSVTELHRNQIEIRLVSEGYLHLSQTAIALETLQKNQSKDTERLREESNVTTRRWLIQLARRYFFDLVRQRLDAGVARSKAMLEFAPEGEKPFIYDVNTRFDDLLRGYAEYEAAADSAWALLEQPAPADAEVQARLDQVSRLESALASSLQRLYGALQARILERVKQAQERERRTGITIIALSVVAIVVGLVATAVAARALRPVRTLIDGAARIGRGDYSAKLGVSGGDDISLLAQQFDAMVSSLTEREAQLAQKQRELLDAERLAAVGKVAAQVAHEVRNPLSSIGLNIEMLGDHLAAASFPSPEAAREARELVGSVTREVDRLTTVTDDYLTLARLPSPTLRRENPVAVLENVLGFVSEELTRSGVSVVWNFPEAAVEVLADEGQLRQVFMNLVRNAREAMGPGGVLTLSADVTPQTVALRFSDTGPGLAPEVRAHLFEPFVTTKKGGTGLGLSLSRQIIQAHGGQLEAAAELPTTFIVRLPRP
ncbi:MAG: HAMP domain-containing protein [Archangium sp.]|nr:HAMP domain-containing protein [Archangium sp.]